MTDARSYAEALASMVAKDPTDQTDNYNTPLSAAQEAAFRQWRTRLPPNLQSAADYDLRGAWKANASAAANGHLPDDWKKPNHPTFSDQSIYSGPYTPGGQWSALPGDKWRFEATPQNLKYRDADALRDYFRRVEPGNEIALPPASMTAPTPQPPQPMTAPPRGLFGLGARR